MTATVPLGIISAQFRSNARGYLHAASILIQSKSTDVDLPIYFLLSHALELALKAFLAAKGKEYDELVDIGHDLEWAYRETLALGLTIEHQYAAPLIARLSDFHRKFVFRYPVLSDDGHLVLVGSVVRAEDVLQFVNQVYRRVEGPVLSARLKAASAGTYPVESWYMGEP